MRVFSLTIGLALVLGLAVAAPSGAEDDEPVRPWPAALRLGPWKPVPASTVREVETSIGRLAGITHDHGGLTWWSAGGPYFEAVRPWHGRTKGERDDADRAFVELVRRGPDAIPALLAHLEDTTRTHLEVAPLGGFGSMWPDTEVDVNVLDAEEGRRAQSVLAPLDETSDEGASADERAPAWRRPFRADVEKHVVTVGDVCFAILGQITNRAYQAVRAQGTGCIVFNSPTHEPRLARTVRAIWSGTEVRAELARRLLQDLGRPDQRYQGGAALRLAVYFPAASESVFAETLDLIETSDQPESLVAPARLAAVAAFARRPGLRDHLLRLALRTHRTDVLLAALAGLESDLSEALRARVRAAIEREESEDGSERALRALRRVLRERRPDSGASAGDDR